MITSPPTMIPTIAPMGRPSVNFSPSGAKGTVGDDVTDIVGSISAVVGGGVVNSLEGVTFLITTVKVNYHEAQ